MGIRQGEINRCLYWETFQECWSVCIIHKLPDDGPDHVCRQFEMSHQLVLQSRQSPSINIHYLTLLLPIPFTFSPYLILVPACIVVSFLLQLMIVLVFCLLFLHTQCSAAIYRHDSFVPIFTNFLSESCNCNCQ